MPRRTGARTRAKAATPGGVEAGRRLGSQHAKELMGKIATRALSERALARDDAPVPALELDAIRNLGILHVMLGSRAHAAAARTPAPRTLDAYRKRLSAALEACPLPTHIEPLTQLRADVETFRRLQVERRRLLRQGTCVAVSGFITDMMTLFHRCHSMTVYSDAEKYDLAGRFVALLATPTCLVCGATHRPAGWRQVRQHDAQRGRNAADRDLYETARAAGQALIRDAPIAGFADHLRILATAEEAARGPGGR